MKRRLITSILQHCIRPHRPAPIATRFLSWYHHLLELAAPSSFSSLLSPIDLFASPLRPFRLLSYSITLYPLIAPLVYHSSSFSGQFNILSQCHRLSFSFSLSIGKASSVDRIESNRAEQSSLHRSITLSLLSSLFSSSLNVSPSLHRSLPTSGRP